MTPRNRPQPAGTTPQPSETIPETPPNHPKITHQTPNHPHPNQRRWIQVDRPPDTGWRDPGTAQRICSNHSFGCSCSHPAAERASLPGTTSSSCPPPTSTTEVAQTLPRRRPRRRNRVSSRPRASTRPTRSWSASNKAAPQRVTSLLTVCQSQPNSLATSSTARPAWPTCLVAHRAARVVSNARSGAISGFCSVNEPTSQDWLGHCQRCFRQLRRAGRPNEGRSTSSTTRVPFDHRGPPQPGHRGRGFRQRTSTSTPPPRVHPPPRRRLLLIRPTPRRMRVGLRSTGVLLTRE